MQSQTTAIQKSTEALHWLLTKSESFPRAYRHSLTQKLLNAAFNVLEELCHALHQGGSTKAKHLRSADAHLLMLRVYIKLAWRWKWLSDGQYRHISLIIRDVGRLIGAARQKPKKEPRD